jgi:hypothetical protein
MRFEINIGKSRHEVIVPKKVERRFGTTCFRGIRHNLAGNFFQWNDAWAFFNDQTVLKFLAEEIQQAIPEMERESRGKNSVCNSFEIEFAHAIGWSSTDTLSNYDVNALEFFEPNRMSIALRVKLNRKDIKAPGTPLATIIYRLRRDMHRYGVRYGVRIESMYPGPDIGELRGRISDREECVFFDWNHPGALIKIEHPTRNAETKEFVA